MRTHLLFFVIFTGAAFVLLPTSFVSAESIDSFVIDDAGSCGNTGYTGIDFDLVLVDPSIVPVARLFNGIVFTPADTGTTVVATSASDPDFDEFVGMLADPGLNFGWEEELVPGGCIFGSGGPLDTDGYMVQSIALTISGLTISVVGSSTEYTFQATVTVEGEPEIVPVKPSTWSRIKNHYR